MVAVAVCVDKIPLPMSVGRFIPRGIDPQDVVGTCIGCNRPDNSGAIVVVRIVPTDGVIDDVYAIGDAVLSRILQIDGVADL